ncbi:hypothetical protein PIB30_074908 [Stylosanthes scabra]|uniref:Uncharacterized protein n=1 Tax=Stylosanthes scabra TaxID=79078 RepID=A0ABU6VRN7_9FABA|nr:hypothetical protein [Stylosanthes scabra]
MDEKEAGVSIDLPSMDIIEISPLRQILQAIKSLTKRVDEMEKGILEAKKSLDKLVFLQFKNEKHQNHEESDNNDKNTSAKKSFCDANRRSSFQMHVKSNQTCVFTKLSDEDEEVEIVNTEPQQELPTCVIGAGKSKSKQKISFLANSITKVKREPMSKIEKQKVKPSIQNMAFKSTRPAKMQKVEHRGQLSSKMMETKQRKGPLMFNTGKAPSTNRINSVTKQAMPFKSTYVSKGTALLEIILSEDYAKCGIQKIVNFEGWDVDDAKGIPKCTNR